MIVAGAFVVCGATAFQALRRSKNRLAWEDNPPAGLTTQDWLRVVVTTVLGFVVAVLSGRYLWGYPPSIFLSFSALVLATCGGMGMWLGLRYDRKPGD